MDGGRVQSIDQMSIAPCRAYGRSRFAVSDLVHPTLTCSADLAHCAASADAAGVVSIDAVVAAVAAPDVQAAFAKAPALYGVDTRPADGAVFHVELGGRALDVGDACPSPDAGSCAPIPAGVSALVALLQALDAQQLAGACSAFK